MRKAALALALSLICVADVANALTPIAAAAAAAGAVAAELSAAAAVAGGHLLESSRPSPPGPRTTGAHADKIPAEASPQQSGLAGV